MAGFEGNTCAWSPSAIPKKPTLKYLTSKTFAKPPSSLNPVLEELGKPHVESFNYILRSGLSKAVQAIPPQEFTVQDNKIILKFMDAQIAYPILPSGTGSVTSMYVYPSECRQRGTTYKGRMLVSIAWTQNDEVQMPLERSVGEVPIMLKSECCHLSRMSPAELIKRGEDSQEFGGYFIVNGVEKFLRMIIVQRRNHPIATSRNGWKNRGKLFSEFGVSMRCVKDDHSAANLILHYLTNGTAKLMFHYQKEMFFVPVVMLLKALCNVTDQYIFNELVKGKEEDTFYRGCVANMLRQMQQEKLFNQAQVNDYIGKKFRSTVGLPESYSNAQITEFLLQECICIHLNSNTDKFNLLVFMTRKLFSLATGQCALESVDNPMNQELLLGGYLYLMVLKEKLAMWLYSLRAVMEKKGVAKFGHRPFKQVDMLHFTSRVSDLTRSMEYLLATGNLVTKSGLALMDNTGFSIVLEKINYMRFISHFHCVHRGAFFTQMRTTSVRKLLPEAWGFICPVHTPDGSPCGLLNHLTALCQVVTAQYSTKRMQQLLCKLGMIPLNSPTASNPDKCYSLLLNGKVLGWVPENQSASFCNCLRNLKATKQEKVPPFLEIGLVCKTGQASLYPGIYLFTSPARMMRPVHNLMTKTVELIGTFEQVFMDICVIPEEAIPEITTHQEIRDTSMLSLLANLIPLSDFNQSPRNMYQCQMAKQTMGTQSHVLTGKPDTKSYRLQTPQSPLMRPAIYEHYNFDDYPLGTNAIVAVISYTGYDMEDAMIINKASLERGFAHGTVYKSEIIDLNATSREVAGSNTTVTRAFGIVHGEEKRLGNIDPDGLPAVGMYFQYGDPFYSCVDLTTGEMHVTKYTFLEPAYIEDVRLLGNTTGTEIACRARITLRISRNPIIGDKFASRHGQKGICSQKWPMQDMPFTESGMIPDIIFNPHGFPSRMTIGMMIESMAGKSAANHGFAHDATPFKFSEDNSAIDYFGKMLEIGGYNYYGTERMYSGVDGRELEADIFFGVVYYQRLRHMVADKFQVRTTGPVDILTHQPVQGRRRGGGIRFGEMERDSLLAHGVSFLLQDRLFNCSDKTLERICVKCGSLLSPILQVPVTTTTSVETNMRWNCSVCNRTDTVEIIGLPYVFKYLICELAAINVKVILNVK